MNYNTTVVVCSLQMSRIMKKHFGKRISPIMMGAFLSPKATLLRVHVTTPHLIVRNTCRPIELTT